MSRFSEIIVKFLKVIRNKNTKARENRIDIKIKFQKKGGRMMLNNNF